MYGEGESIRNKAGYMATEVARGWAGAIFEVTRPFWQHQCGSRKNIIKKVKHDRPTNGHATKNVLKVKAARLEVRENYFNICVAITWNQISDEVRHRQGQQL